MNELEPSKNPSLAPRQGAMSAGVQTQSSREMQEVEAAVFIAKKFPRDINQIDVLVERACQRVKLAEKSMYAYPRGKTTVTGPTIRLAEAIAQIYGNLSFGIKELDQKNGESTVQAYCWDYETNVRQEKTFHVKHERKANNRITKLTDPRDIYELVANNGARRLRACILGVIPGDIIENAIEACDKTLKGATSTPLADRIKGMVKAYVKIGVTQEMLEKRLGHNIDVVIETELLELGKIFNGIRDGLSKREDWFEFAKKPDQTTSADLNAKLGDKEPEKKDAAEKE